MLLTRGKHMADLLEVKNLSVCFNTNNGQLTAVDNISFSVADGEILGIVGESGSGKSVTALSLLQLLPYPQAFHPTGSSIKFDDQEIVNTTENTMQKLRGNNMSYIFQEPMSSLNPLHTVEAQISESLMLHRGMNRQQARRETLRLLTAAGIKNARNRLKSYPFELSGGQRQRVMIAMAIANHPRLLIADEPTTALDVTIQEQIIRLLLDLRKKLGMAIIFISHDLRLIRKIADRIIVMKDGKIVEQGNTAAIFTNPKNDYTKELINSSISLININKASKENILKAQNLTVSYPLKKNFWGRVTQTLFALNKVSLEIKKGECLGIVGESGSGKTTLGMVLAQLISYQGNIELKGLPVNRLKNKEIHKQIQIVFQDPYNSLNPRMNIEQIIGEGLEIHFPQLNQEERRKRIINTLKDVGLPADILNKYPHEFSGGQRQRIAIARSLVISPEIIVFDEPTSALDVTIQAQVLKMLSKIKGKYNLTYVFISHDMTVIRAVSDRIAVMYNGKIIEQGEAKQIFEHPQEEYTRRLISAAL